MVPLHLFYPIHPKMPLEMIAGSQIYHNKSSGKNYGLLGSIGTMHEQRSAARGEVLVRFGDFRTTISYSLDWIRENCWIRSTDLSEHHAFHLKPFLEKYAIFAVENVKHISPDINHSQIKRFVDHVENVAKMESYIADRQSELAVKMVRNTANDNARLRFLAKHKAANPQNLREYLRLLMCGDPLHIELPTHIAKFHKIAPTIEVIPEGLDNGGAGRVQARTLPLNANPRAPGLLSLPLVVVFGSIDTTIYKGMHDFDVPQRAQQWLDLCRKAMARWPVSLDTSGVMYELGRAQVPYLVRDVSITPAGTVTITGYRDGNKGARTSVSFGNHVDAVAAKVSDAPREAVTDLSAQDEPRRHLLAVRHSDGKLDVIRVCQTYRITDNAAKNYLANNLHDKLVMYAESDVVVHVDNARDVGSAVKLETRKVWSEVQTYEREFQISISKPQS